jgi:uncharacterized protein YceH (UPF0502 family)
VVETLQGLLEREGEPLVARLPRKPNRQDHEYAHLLSGTIESMPVAEAAAHVRAPSRTAELEGRVAALEQEVRELREALQQMRAEREEEKS